MKPSNVLEALETSPTPWVVVAGSLIGIVFALGSATAVVVLAGKWHRWLGAALSVVVLIATFHTVLELVGAIRLREDADVTVSAGSVRSLILIKVIELLLFICSLVVLYVLL